MQIQCHQACSSIGKLLYIQLYVPTEYETTAGCSPNIFQAKTLMFIWKNSSSKQKQAYQNINKLTYVVMKLCLTLSLSDSVSAHVKLFRTVILPYNLKRIKFSGFKKICSTLFSRCCKISKSACEGPRISRPDKKSSPSKILGYIVLIVQCFYYVLYITHVITKCTI